MNYESRKGKIDCVNRGLREMKYAITFPVGETAYLGHQRKILRTIAKFWLTCIFRSVTISDFKDR
jgi:hypothetical protein